MDATKLQTQQLQKKQQPVINDPEFMDATNRHMTKRLDNCQLIPHSRSY